MTSKKNTTSQEVNVNKVKKVNQNVNKIEDMKNSNVNPAVDQRIVDLGEVIKTKLSSVSKTKRVNLKQSKVEYLPCFSFLNSPPSLSLIIGMTLIS